jgi:hypothetical protein
MLTQSLMGTTVFLLIWWGIYYGYIQSEVQNLWFLPTIVVNALTAVGSCVVGKADCLTDSGLNIFPPHTPRRYPGLTDRDLSDVLSVSRGHNTVFLPSDSEVAVEKKRSWPPRFEVERIENTERLWALKSAYLQRKTIFLGFY